MATLPYLTTPGNLSKAFVAIQGAATPDKVSQDFVKTMLGIPGGSGDNMTTFLRRIGFVETDGKPSDLYKKFRNTETSGAAVAAAMKIAYREIFRRNEFAYNLSDDEIKGHVVEITGNAAEARNVALTVTTFSNMKSFADFGAELAPISQSRSIRGEVAPVGDDLREAAPQKLSYRFSFESWLYY